MFVTLIYVCLDKGSSIYSRERLRRSKMLPLDYHPCWGFRLERKRCILAVLLKMASITERKRSNTVIGKLLNMWLDQSTQRANNNQCSILWVFKTVIMKVRADNRHKLKDQRFTTAGRRDREYIIPLDKFEQRFFFNCMVSGFEFP